MAIRAKLVIIVFVFAILPMFLVTARWSSTAVSSRTASLRAGLDERAREIAGNIDQMLRMRFAEMSKLTDTPAMKAYAHSLVANDSAVPDGLLHTGLSAFMLGYQPQYSSLIAVNRAGKPLFRVDNGTEPDGSFRAYLTESGFADDDAKLADEVLKNPRPDLPIVSDVERGANGFVVRIGIQVRHYGENAVSGLVEGQTVAALIAKIRVEQLLVESAGLRPNLHATPGTKPPAIGQSAIILDHNGTVLYAADPKTQGKRFQEAFPDFAPALASTLSNIGRNATENDLSSIWGSDWLIRAIRHPASASASSSAGASANASAEEIRAPQLSILVLENRSDAVRELEFAGFTMYLLTFVLAIVLTLLLYYLISGVTDSIRRVTRGARAITAGKLDHRIEVRPDEARLLTALSGLANWVRRTLGSELQSGDETRVLADAFNRMAARLREMIARESEQKQFESFTRLSAVLTHDLKNSIFSLSLLVQNMERKFDREGFREDAMRTLSNSVNDLQGLVARLSDPLAQSTLRQSSDLSLIVERVLRRIGEHAGARYEISSALLPRLSANVDAKAVERVIENLMINALEAMPDGGKLNVASRVENEAAIITVTDTGKGMSEEFINERLFRPFATTKKKGIGLGLYSCRDIIEQHGGRIEVTSQLYAGTEFRVVLPLVTEAARIAEGQAAAV